MMKKAFFSHAHEDKATVEQIYLRLIKEYPDIKGWMDMYEIVGGNDLIDKIALGIETSDKFLIFLSEQSITKPWVHAELKKALMKEINGVNPDFIIPIKLGKLSTVPAFLESKFYIDLLSKTEKEWLDDIYRALTDTKKKPAAAQENLTIEIVKANDAPNVAVIIFSAQFWAEEIGFKIKTKKTITDRRFRFLHRTGGGQYNSGEYSTASEYGITMSNYKIEKGAPFAVALFMEGSVDPVQDIESVQKWDGSNLHISGTTVIANLSDWCMSNLNM